MELQMSEERGKCQSIIENMYVEKKKKKGRKGERKNQHCMPPGKGIWMLMIYSTPSPQT